MIDASEVRGRMDSGPGFGSPAHRLAQLQDLHAEQAVIGAMLLDPGACERVMAYCRTQTFYRWAHNVVYGVARKLHEDDRPVDLITVAGVLRVTPAEVWCLGTEGNCLDEIGGPEYLTALIAEVPTTAHVVAYIEHLNKLAVERCKMAEAQSALSGDDDARLRWVRWRDELEAVEHGPGLKAAGDIDMIGGLEVFLSQQTFTDSDETPHFGLHDLDRLAGPLGPGLVSILKGDTGEGKSQLALEALGHWCLLREFGGHGQPGVYLSPEMDARSEVGPRLAMLLCPPMPTEDALASAIVKVMQSPIEIMDRPEVTIEEVAAELRTRKRATGSFPKLLVVDHIQEIKTLTTEDERLGLAHIAQRFRTLARELQTHVLVLSQLTVTEDGERKTFGARQIGQKANRIYDIRRPGKTREERQQATEARVVLEKNRGGRAGMAATLTIDAAGRFCDAPGAEHTRGVQYYQGDSADAWEDGG